LVGDRLAIHNLDGGGLVSCGFWHISRLPRLPIAIFLPLILALLPLFVFVAMARTMSYPSDGVDDCQSDARVQPLAGGGRTHNPASIHGL
jgi:hypothetical protein